MNKLRQIRRSKDISQEELAKALGVTQGAVSGWERGSWNPTLETLRKISRVLKCTVEELIGDADDEGRA